MERSLRQNGRYVVTNQKLQYKSRVENTRSSRIGLKYQLHKCPSGQVRELQNAISVYT